MTKKKNNLLVINGRFLSQKLTGVQRYALELTKGLINSQLALKILTPYDEINPVYKDISHLVIKERGVFKGHLWEQVELPLLLKRYGNPLLLNYTSTGPLGYSNKIVTVHDLVFIHHKEAISFAFRNYYKYMVPLSVKTSKKVLTVSDFSKNDICNTYNITREKVDVVYNAGGLITKSLQIKKDYFLIVGSVQPYKNIDLAIRTFLKFKVQYDLQTLKLFIVGGSNSKVFNNVINAIDNDSVQRLGYVTDQELKTYYSEAKALIFPSLFEGFGIPTIEAMSAGCPVIASDKASIPEVCGDAAIYFDPNNEVSLINSIKQLYFDEKLQQKMVEKGYKNLSRFSWEKSTNRLKSIINGLS